MREVGREEEAGDGQRGNSHDAKFRDHASSRLHGSGEGCRLGPARQANTAAARQDKPQLFTALIGNATRGREGWDRALRRRGVDHPHGHTGHAWVVQGLAGYQLDLIITAPGGSAEDTEGIFDY